MAQNMPPEDEVTPPRPESPTCIEDMAGHIEMQMTCLLKPFAERVRQIMDATEHLSARIDRSDATVEIHAERLADMSKWSQQIKGSLQASQAHLTAMQNNATKLHEEKAALQQGHADMRAAIDQLDLQFHNLERPLMEQRKDLDTVEEKIAQLRSEFGNQQEHMAESVKPDLLQAIEGLKGLDDRHKQTMENLAQNKSDMDQLAHALKDFKKAQSKQHQEDKQTTASINAQIKRLKNSVDDTANDMKQNREDVQTTVADMKTAQSTIEKLTHDVMPMKYKVEEQGKTLLNFKVRVPPLEKGLCQLLEVANKPVKSDSKGNRKNVAEFIQELEHMIQENIANINLLNKSQEAQDAHFNKCNENMQKQIRDLHDSLDNTGKTLDDLKILHTDAMNTLDSSMKLHEETKQEFRAQNSKVDCICNDVGGLQSQLSAAKDGMAKMGSSLEIFNETFNGLRKGLKNANTRVAGGADDSLLPEPSNARSNTPTLPGMRGIKTASPATLAWAPRDENNSGRESARGMHANTARGDVRGGRTLAR